jgi:hypothetical protein
MYTAEFQNLNDHPFFRKAKQLTVMKRNSYSSNSIQVKAEAIKKVQSGVKKKHVCEEYNLPRTTLNGWLKEKTKIVAALETAKFTPERKRMRQCNYQELDQCLLLWFQKMRSQKASISANTLSTKANFFAAQLGMNDFTCSVGWIERFKARHSIVVKLISGESNSCNQVGVEEWNRSALPLLLNEYSPANIYNADETGLFWQLLPTTTHAFKGETCSGGKASKQRITIMICANADGSDKRPLLVIGKSAKPRCFKNIHRLPVEYTANKKAWMVSSLFESYVTNLDKCMTAQNRKIVLIIDNCPAHPEIDGLRSVKMVYLPPNTTSKIQPMDAGVIRAFKCHYRRLMCTHYICVIESGKPFEPNLLLALRLAKQAWDCVKSESILNCFRHCGITAPLPANVADIPDPMREVDNIFDQLRRFINITISAHDYATSDDALETSEVMTDDDIIAHVKSASDENDVDVAQPISVEDDPDEEVPLVTHLAAYQAVETLQHYLEQQDIKFDLAQLSAITCKNNLPRLKQTTLSHFIQHS